MRWPKSRRVSPGPEPGGSPGAWWFSTERASLPGRVAATVVGAARHPPRQRPDPAAGPTRGGPGRRRRAVLVGPAALRPRPRGAGGGPPPLLPAPRPRVLAPSLHAPRGLWRDLRGRPPPAAAGPPA